MPPPARRSAESTDPAPDRERVWARLWDAHAPALFLFARQWLADPTSAEDAVQAGFVKFWRARGAHGGVDVPLLFAAVRSEALDLLRSSSRRAERERRAAIDDAWWEADPLVGREREAAVRAALEALPPEQREAVVLRVWAGLSFAEIARALDANENTVTARCRRGLEKLERLLPEECRESP
ncbi:MAG: RNA polymerase sigma factor [Planctomycetaceae bacterium]